MESTQERKDAYRSYISGGQFNFKDNREPGKVLKFIPSPTDAVRAALPDVLDMLGVKVGADTMTYDEGSRILTVRITNDEYYAKTGIDDMSISDRITAYSASHGYNQYNPPSTGVPPR